MSGVYNPAVDVGDGFDANEQAFDPGAEQTDIMRDRIPVSYKGNMYFEVWDYLPTRPMEAYSDRLTNLSSLPNQVSSTNKDAQLRVPPSANHEYPSLRTLPHSALRVYKNGKLIGTAFENLLAFLPPASAPVKTAGGREAFDDGMAGYFPAVSCFWGGMAEVNFGDGPQGFWAPPAHLVNTRDRLTNNPAVATTGPDVEMADAGIDASGTRKGWNPGRVHRAVGERYKEQIAEDFVWDIIDEVDFYVQDAGDPDSAGAVEQRIGEKSSRLKDEIV